MSDYIKIGNRCCVLGAGHDGKITKVTKTGEVWVRVRSRWGNHHHPVTAKTFRYPRERIAPIECSLNHIICDTGNATTDKPDPIPQETK